MFNWKHQLLVFGITVLVGVSIYLVFGWLPPLVPNLEFGRTSLQETVLSYMVLFIWSFLAYWLSLFIHELGHALFGFLAGFSFNFIRIGRYMLVYSNGKLIFRKIAAVSWVGMYSGFPRDEKDLRHRWIFMCLGGVTLNLLTALLLILVLVFWFGRERIKLWDLLQQVTPGQVEMFFRMQPIQADVAQNILGSGLAMLLLNNVVFVFGNLFPVRLNSNSMTDGLLILDALRNETSYLQNMGMTLLYGAIHHKVPVRQWKPEWFEMSLKNPTQSLQYANALYLAYVFAVDTNDIPKGRQYIEQLNTLCEALDWKDVKNFGLELAWFAAWHDQNLERAKALLQIAETVDLPIFIRKRAEAAIAFADGKFLEARESIQIGLADYAERGSPYLGAFEARSLEEMLKKVT